jgi:hypothetical protein
MNWLLAWLALNALFVVWRFMVGMQRLKCGDARAIRRYGVTR